MIDTDLNVNPYYDDYDANNNYVRILFRPGLGVQARELTQLQTALQNQIETFGDHVFTEGTVIRGCAFNFIDSYHFLKIRDNAIDGQTVNPAQLVNARLTEPSSNLTAIVMNYSTGLESQNPDLNTLYVRYINTGANNEQAFANGQTLTAYANNYALQTLTIVTAGSGYSNSDKLVFTGGGGSGAEGTVRTNANGAITTVALTNAGSGYTSVPTVSIANSSGGSANGTSGSVTVTNYIQQIQIANSSIATPGNTDTYPTGMSQAFRVSDGVIFQKGFFLVVDTQEIIVSKYNQTASNVVVGFNVVESIVNSSSDSSLLDPASGFNNYNAPGATRLKLEPTLVTMSKANAEANSNFFSLVEYQNGIPTRQRQQTQYNQLGNELAKRTSDESGNYVVNPFRVITEEISGNTTHINAAVSSGLAYVDGYRVEQFGKTLIPVRRGDDVVEKQNQVISTNFGSYIIVKELVGAFKFNGVESVSLRDTAAARITSGNYTVGAAPGNEVGTAKVVGFEYHSGIPGTPTCEYRLYLTNITMNSGKTFNDVASIFYDGTYDAVADIVSAPATLEDSSRGSLVFPFSKSAIKTLRNLSNGNDTQFVYRTYNSNGNFGTGGTLTLTLTGSDTFPYSVGTLSSVEETEIDVVLLAAANSTGTFTGTVSVTSGANTVTGSGTAFVTEYRADDYIGINGEFKRITAISNNTYMTVGTNFSSSAAANTHKRHYPAYRAIPFSKANRSISVASGQQSLTLNVGEGLSSSVNAIVVHNVTRSSAIQIAKTITKDAKVKIATATNDANTVGPWCLGVPDVLSISSVTKTTNADYTTGATDVTSHFELVTGQQDGYYGLSYIRKRSGSSLSIGATDYIVVTFDVLKADSTNGGAGFFSVDSYPIDDATTPLPSDKIRTEQIPVYISPSTSRRYDLRDCVDFRPVATNTAVYTTSLGSANVNPSATLAFSSSEKYLPAPNKLFTADLQAYLGRIDKLAIGSSGQITVIAGEAVETPYPPQDINGSMTIATLIIPPYPSLTPQQAVESERTDYAIRTIQDQVKRLTMQDLNSLETRVKRLEYYTTLSLLEQKTRDLVIPSEIDAATNRFKNGIFVDSFKDFSFSDVGNEEYNASVDRSAEEMIPPFKQTIVDLDANTLTNVVQTGDVLMLNYNEVTLMSQPYATRFRNCAENYWNFAGNLTLLPNYDNFFETRTSPRNTAIIGVDTAAPVLALVDSLNEIMAVNRPVIDTQVSTIQNVLNSTVANGIQTDTVETVTTTTTTTTSNQFRGDVNTTVTPVGDFVTDISFTPFIREQAVHFYATGLRPGAKVHVFFDKTYATDRVIPANIINSALLDGTWDSLDYLAETGTTLTARAALSTADQALTVGTDGTVAGVLYIPANTYFVGDREVLIVDVDDYDSVSAGTTSSRSTFRAYNFSASTQSVAVSTRAADVSFGEVTDTAVTTTRTTGTRTTVVGGGATNPIEGFGGIFNITDWLWVRQADPIAQTFALTSQIAGSRNGAMITSIDLFFKQKDSSRGVTVELRTTENGYPSSTVLPFGRKYVPSSAINVSDDGTTATNVVFDTPVYLNSDVEYAFVVIPEATSPDYLIFTGQAGQSDLSTGVAVKQDWGNGAMFQSTNNSAWQSVQNEDIKFTLYCAEFTASSGTAVLENENYEFITPSSQNGTFIQGEQVVKYDASANLTGTVTANTTSNTVTGTSTTFLSSLSAGRMLLIPNSNSAPTAFDLVKIASIANNTSLTLVRPPKHALANGAFQAPPSATVSLYDSTNSKLILNGSTAANSTFKFANSDVIIGINSGANCAITLSDLNVSYFQPLIYRTVPSATGMTFEYQAANSALSVQTIASAKMNDSNYITAYSGVIGSKSNEIAAGNKTFKATLTLYSSSNRISPIIDLQSASILCYENQINNSTTNEHLRSGSATVKHLTLPVTLANSMEAEDVLVYLTGYKPSGSDIKVYAKLLGPWDGEAFVDKSWTELSCDNGTTYSDVLDRNDFKEFVYRLPNTIPGTAITGVATVANNSTTVSGVGTSFNTDLSAGSVVRIINPADSAQYNITIVTAVANSTSMTIGNVPSFNASGATIEKATVNSVAFANPANDGVSRYYSSSGAAHDGFGVFALKIVLLSTASNIVPRVRDIRGIALSV